MTYFTVKEIADLLSVNEETVRRWIREEKINAERGNGRQGSKISSEALIEYLNKNKGLINESVAVTLGIGGVVEFGSAARGVPAFGLAATASWINILKLKNKDKFKMRIELIEKEAEFNAYINQLKDDISQRKHEIEIRINELEKVEKELIRLTEVLRGLG